MTDNPLALATRLDNLEAVLSQEMQDRRFERYHDYLTGLANDRLMHRFIEEHGRCWFVACDLNDFKRFQDRMGSHRSGDLVLKMFAKFLEDCTRSGLDRRTIPRSERRARNGDVDKILADKRLAVRMHGDEFVIVTSSKEGAEGIAARISKWASRGVTASAGVGRTMDAADRQMYKNKRARKLRRRLRWYYAVGTIVAIVGLVYHADTLATGLGYLLKMAQ